MHFLKKYIAAICSDFQYYTTYHGKSSNRIKSYILTLFDFGFVALIIFRFGKTAQLIKNKVIRKVFLLSYFFLYKLSDAVTGIHIDSNSTIGKNLLIHNFGGIIIVGKIGDNVTIVQGVQLVSRADGKAAGWPTIENDVYLGTGAKILGSVVIGNNSIVGANCVVRKDIPPNSIVLPPEPVVVSA